MQTRSNNLFVDNKDRYSNVAVAATGRRPAMAANTWSVPGKASAKMQWRQPKGGLPWLLTGGLCLRGANGTMTR
eukprot:1146088-Pelagomonas_calceolata.AAC.11